MKQISAISIFFLFVVLGSAKAQTLPGDACASAGAYRQSGGAELPNGYILVCDGTNWQSIVDYSSSGSVLFRVGNDATACSAALGGELRYNSNNIEYCNDTSWTTLASAGSTAAAGNNGEIQFNSSGSLGASSNFFWDNTNGRLGIGDNTPAAPLSFGGLTNGALRDVMDLSGFVWQVKPDWIQEIALNGPYGNNMLWMDNGSADGGKITLTASVTGGTANTYIGLYSGDQVRIGFDSPDSGTPIDLAFWNTIGGSHAANIYSWQGGTNDGFLEFSVRQDGGTTSDLLVLNGETNGVGVGVAAPSTLLHVLEDNATNNGVTSITRLTHTTSGVPAAGIGVGMDFEAETSAGNNEIGASIHALATDVTVASEDFDLIFNTMAAGAIASEKMRISSTGYVGIGDTTPDVALDVVGDIHYTGSITDVSDKRLKDNIKRLSGQLAKVTALEPVTFTMKDDPDKKTEYGFIAQDVELLYPGLVRTSNDEMGTKGLNYIGLIAPMVEAMKEQQALIQEQKAMINSLELRVKALESSNE